MTNAQYDAHKETLAAGKIVTSGGRTAATLNELATLRDIENGNPFGGAKDDRVMAIHSGRLSPQMIAEFGPDHPLIVAARKLTEAELDALTDFLSGPAPAGEEEASPVAAETETAPKPVADIKPVPDVREAAVQSQLAVGTLDAVTPKTALDNKTSATEPAGKNASKPEADAAQDAEKAGAKTATG